MKKTLVVVLLVSASTSAEAQRDVTIEFHDAIDVTADRRGDRHTNADRPTDGGGGNSRSGRIGNRGNALPARPTITVKIGQAAFNVSPEANRRLAEIIELRQTNGMVGSIVAAVASAYSLFSVMDVDPRTAWGAAESIYNPASTAFDPDELATQLAAPGIWNRFVRSQTVAMIELEILEAAQKNRRDEMKMWQLFRDIIANPERYQNGGIKYDRQTRSIQTRNPAAESYRAERGSDVVDADRLGFIELTNELMTAASARDYLMQSDYIWHLNPGNGPLTSISRRDLLLMNAAMQSLSPQAKQYLDQRLYQTAIRAGTTYSFWQRLRSFLQNSYAWQEHPGSAGDTPMPDELGFSEDMPSNSDIVYGEYPKVQQAFTYPSGFVRVPQGQAPPPGTYSFRWDPNPR